MKCQLAAMQSCTPALDTNQLRRSSCGSKAGGRAATETQSAALQPQDLAPPLVSEPVRRPSLQPRAELTLCMQQRLCQCCKGRQTTCWPWRAACSGQHWQGAAPAMPRLPLTARTCLLRTQDALLAASPAQRDSTAVLASAAAMTPPGGSAQDADSPAGQGSEPASAEPEAAAAAVVEGSMLPLLPFEGLSQRLSQVHFLATLFPRGADCLRVEPRHLSTHARAKSCSLVVKAGRHGFRAHVSGWRASS